MGLSSHFLVVWPTSGPLPPSRLLLTWIFLLAHQTLPLLTCLFLQLNRFAAGPSLRLTRSPYFTYSILPVIPWNFSPSLLSTDCTCFSCLYHIGTSSNSFFSPLWGEMGPSLKLIYYSPLTFLIVLAKFILRYTLEILQNSYLCEYKLKCIPLRTPVC